MFSLEVMEMTSCSVLFIVGASQQGGNPLEWFARLNPFDRSRREEGEAARSESTLKSSYLRANFDVHTDLETIYTLAYPNGYFND